MAKAGARLSFGDLYATCCLATAVGSLAVVFLLGCAGSKPTAEGDMGPDEHIPIGPPEREYVRNSYEMLKRYSELRTGLRDVKNFSGNAKPLTDAQLRLSKEFVESHPDYRSYLLLLAIRDQSRDLYDQISNETKAAVLASTLAETRHFNDWPDLAEDRQPWHTGPEPALLETGKVAIKYLRPILKNTQPAYMVGSLETWAAGQYKYTRADYAYREISLILGRKPFFSPDPAEREQHIQALIKELRN
jgi:hypothetical protein